MSKYEYDVTELSKMTESLFGFKPDTDFQGHLTQAGIPVPMGPTGFDAKTTREQYFVKVNARPVTPKDKPIAVAGNTKLYSKCQPKQDVLMFISLFLKYGNNLNKALRELKNSRIIRIKCMLYDIETDASQGRKLKRNQLSLSRIALAFPTHTATIILKNQTNGILQYSSFFKQKLPLVMQHTVFPGLIPAEKFTEELKGITSILNMEISVLFASKKYQKGFIHFMVWMEEATVEKMVESSAKYVDSAIKNGIEDEKKLEILTKAGVLEVNTDGELELSAGTVALVNQLADIKAVYSLTYSDAIKKLNCV